MLAARRAIIVVELSINLRRILGERLGCSDNHRLRCAVHFSPTLLRNFPQGLLERGGVNILGQALTFSLAKIIHADCSDRLDARIGFRGGQAKTAAAADADDADALSIHKWLRAQKIDGGAEILNQSLEGSGEMRLAATLAVIGRIMGDGDKAALGHRSCVLACSLLILRNSRHADS